MINSKDFLSYYHYHKFDKKYDELIEQARKKNPLPETTEKKRGRKKKGKILVLVERLRITRPQSAFLSITSMSRLTTTRRKRKISAYFLTD